MTRFQPPLYRFAFKRTALSLAFITLASTYAGTYALAASQTDSASGSTVQYSLGAMKLTDALKKIAQLSGVTVHFSEADTNKYKSSRVSGLLTVEKAIQEALLETPLKVTVDQNRDYWISSEAKAGTDSVVIYAKRDDAETGFKVDHSSTTTRSGASLMSLPSAITILSAKVLESEQSLSVQDALQNVSGVVVQSNPYAGANYAIRGFTQGSGLVNGLSDGSASTVVSMDDVERIEVLKGPQAVLAGSNLLGGAVNLVTKKPSADPLKQLKVQYGSFGDATVAVDLNGPVKPEDKRLSYRLNASYEHSDDTFGGYGYDGKKIETLLSQLRWKDSSTDLIVGAQGGDSHLPLTPYTMALNGFIETPPTTRLSNASDGFDHHNKSIFYSLTQNLSDTVTLESKMNKTWSHGQFAIYTPTFPIDPIIGIVQYYPTNQQNHGNQLTGDHYLRWTFFTGEVRHRLVVGANHTESHYLSSQYDGGEARRGIALPVFATTQFNFPQIGGNVSNQSQIDTKEYGAYVQDLINWKDFSFSLSTRRNFYNATTTTSYPQTPEFNSSGTMRQYATTPSVGVVYQVSPAMSVYANYAQGYVPNTGLDCQNTPFKPETSVNREAGLKFDLLDGKLGITTTYFQLAQKNLATPDAILPCSNSRAAQTNQGIEFDVQGEISQGWNIIFNYAGISYSSPSDIMEVPSAGYPKKRASFWTTYDVQDSRWKGLGIAFGLTATGRSDGSVYQSGDFIVPGSVRFDTSISYHQPKWSLIFGVKNLLDSHQYNFANNPTYVPLLPGRTATMTFIRNFE